MLPITDEITVLSLLHPCTPCTLVEINEVKCIRQGAHKSNRISSSLCSHNIGLSLKYIYMNMSVKCYLCTYVVYHITCMLGDNKDIVNWIELNGFDDDISTYMYKRRFHAIADKTHDVWTKISGSDYPIYTPLICCDFVNTYCILQIQHKFATLEMRTYTVEARCYLTATPAALKKELVSFSHI